MEITFLVGNGFDMAAGVNTSYSRFYEWYIRQKGSRSCIKMLKNMIKTDIESGGQYWADFEIGLGNFTEKFSPNETTDFLDCYDDAQEKLQEYLKNECAGKAYRPDAEEIKRARRAISTFYSGMDPESKEEMKSFFDVDKQNNSCIHFISFNYTDILDKYVKMLSEGPIDTWLYGSIPRKLTADSRVIHVHGYTDRYPIIGVNDESQVKNKDLLKSLVLRQTLIKANAVSAVGELWHSDAEAIINRSDVVCVFGMSLECTDAKWWGKLIEWLKGKEKRRLVLFWYKESGPSPVSIRQKIELDQEIKDKLMVYVGDKEEAKAAIYDRIRVCINTEIFPVKLSDEMDDAVVASTQKAKVEV